MKRAAREADYRHRSRIAIIPPGYSSGPAPILREPDAEQVMRLPTDGTGVSPGNGVR
jgi:hypothetical protein